jgi:hypothetical protein
MRPPGRRERKLLVTPIAVLAGGILLALAYVAYILWPRWPTAVVAIDAPSLPITINAVTFNIPPAAIRAKVQRKPGTQERIDLAFLWPSLAPPDLTQRSEPVISPKMVDRVFLSIAGSENTLSPIERIKTIYPRYLDTSISTGPGGLAVRPFRDGTPYQGEDLLYDHGNPERFVVRCTRDGAAGMIGICLFERRIGNADLTARFPRDWLNDWNAVGSGMERLIASLRASVR